MGYWTGNKTNWELDRGGRRKVFDLLKDRTSYSAVKPKIPKELRSKDEIHSWNSRKPSTILRMIGFILQIALVLFVFYAAGMLLAYGKHWP